MSKRKPNVTKGLLDAAVAAFFSAVEIHNKPRIEYRYPSSTLLIINAWELLLKAFLYKNTGSTSIYEKPKKGESRSYPRTISLDKAIAKVREEINKSEPTYFDAIAENIEALGDYRDQFAHYFERELDPVVFMLLSKSVIDFNKFIEKWFNKNIMQSENLILLPIGFQLPFEPTDFLCKKLSNETASSYVLSINERIKRLNGAGVTESIVVGFEIAYAGVKNPKNADIIAKIVSQSEEATHITQHKVYRLTGSRDAASAVISEDEVLKQYPYSKAELKEKVKEAFPEIKLGKVFESIVAITKQMREYSYSRTNNPKAKRKQETYFYNDVAVAFIIDEWKKALAQAVDEGEDDA